MGLKLMMQEQNYRMQAVAEWNARYPEVAAAWEEALVENERISAERAAAKWRRRMLDEAASALSRSGAPRTVAERVVEDVRSGSARDTQSMSAARRYVESRTLTKAQRPTFLLLFGGVGSGKTYAALWAMFELLQGRQNEEWEVVLDGNRGRFIRGAEVARFPRFGDGAEREWQAMLDKRVVVLDDLGAESRGQFASDQIDDLLSYRHGNGLRTIITSNLSPEQILERYGERIASRFAESSVVAGSGNDDLRRQK